MSAIALPTYYPGKKFVNIAGTACLQGVSTAPGVANTTTVFGYVLAITVTSSSWPSPNDKFGLSHPSPELVPINTIATSLC